MSRCDKARRSDRSSSDACEKESEVTGDGPGAWEETVDCDRREALADKWDPRWADEDILEGSMAYIHLGAHV